MNDFITLTLENIDKEHICCAIGDKKHDAGVKTKKEWIKDRIKEGHVFRKLNAQGKIFIEYAPIEKAWVPVVGSGYEYIYCLWVAGSFKGKGYGKELLEYAINDAKAKGEKGLCAISSLKKKPFVSDKKFYEKYGFKVVDKINDYELMVLSFDNDSDVPRFNDNMRKQEIENKNFTVYYSPQCPYTLNCIKEINEYMEEKNIVIDIVCVDNLEKAKNVPCVFNNWANFNNGKFISGTLLNKNSLDKLIKK